MLWPIARAIATTRAAKTPSTAFCLLLRLFTIRCTESQMKLMLDHVDSPYIRCIGFLYLRYAADPNIIWKSFQPYLYDQEAVTVRANVNAKESTVGEFVRGLLTDLEFYGTRLPRLPIAIEREIKEKLLQEEEIEQRAQRHFSDSKLMEYFEKIGSRVKAMYGDEENEVAWYDAVVDRVLRKDDETGVQFSRPKFIVTFLEYGNTESVSLGEMDMPGVDHTCPLPRGAIGGNQREDSIHASHHHGKYDGRGRTSDDKYRRESARYYDDTPKAEYARGYRHDNDNRRDIRNRHSYRNYDDDRHHSNRHRIRSRSRDRSLPDESDPRRDDIRRDSRFLSSTFKQSLENAVIADTKLTGHANETKHDGLIHASTMTPNIQIQSENNEKKDMELKSPSKTPEQLVAVAEKKRKLLAKYG